MSGKIKIIVKTKNKERLINKLKNVYIENITENIDSVSFIAKKADKEQILDILSRSLYNNYVCEELTLKTRLITKIFSLAFLAMFLVVAILPFAFCCRIEINADESIAYSVKKITSESVSVPCKKDDIDMSKLKSDIMSIDGVSFCEISQLLGKVKITAYGSEKVEIEEDRLEIKSSFDGIVSKIIVLSGTPNVKVGDKVSFGDVLILGKVIDEKTGRETVTLAKGEVYGIETEEYSFFLPKKYLSLTKTGNIKKASSIVFFGKEYTKKSPYKYYETVEKSIDIEKGIFFPITIKKKEYVELALTEKDTDVEFEIEKLKRKEQEKASEMLYEIKEIKTSLKESADNYVLEMTVSFEKRMG